MSLNQEEKKARIDVLRGAMKIAVRMIELLKSGWRQGYYAADAEGHECPSNSESAVCFCIRGAQDRAVHDSSNCYWEEPNQALCVAGGELLPNGWVTFNDAPGRTQEEVVAKAQEIHDKLHAELVELTKPTIEQIIDEVVRLAETYPNAVYMANSGGPGCSYIKGVVYNGPEGKCGCIVGQAVRTLWPDCPIGKLDLSCRAVTALGLWGIEASEDQENWLYQIQTVQDIGKPWNQCLRSTREKYPTVAGSNPPTVEEVIAEVCKLAEEFPNAVYDGTNGCDFVKGSVADGPDTCGCLIGQALRRAWKGPKPKNFDERMGSESFPGALLRKFKITFTDSQREWLRRAQVIQDERGTWSKAVREARKAHKNIAPPQKKPTAKEIIAEVRRLAEEFPRARYRKQDGWAACRNLEGRVENGPETCGCLIGQAIVRIWPEAPFNPYNASDGADHLIPHTLGVETTKDELNWLGTSQGMQDRGALWGEAIEAADKVVPSLAPCKLTLAGIIQEVRKLAEEHPEAVYENSGKACRYTRGSAGSGEGCIVGQGILACDPNLDPFLREVDRAITGVCTLFERIENAKKITVAGSNAIGTEWLIDVQNLQDNGGKWSNAVDTADKMYPEVPKAIEDLRQAVLLEAAAKLIEDKGWCQGSCAKDITGHPVSAHADDACSFCMFGALCRVGFPCTNLSHVFYELLKPIIGEGGIPFFNDHKDRTKEEVIDAFRKGAQMLREGAKLALEGAPKS